MLAWRHYIWWENLAICEIVLICKEGYENCKQKFALKNSWILLEILFIFLTVNLPKEEDLNGTAKEISNDDEGYWDEVSTDDYNFNDTLVKEDGQGETNSSNVNGTFTLFFTNIIRWT